jgi:hypothetical protein
VFIAFTLAALLGLTLTGAVKVDARRRRKHAAQEAADDLEAARLRLVSAGEDPDGIAVWTYGPPAGTVYGTPVVAEPEPLVIDPTVVEHVAPGAGSLVSFAEAQQDTAMRTSVEAAELHAAEEAAYEAREDEEVRLLMADFDRQMCAALTDFAVGTRKVDRWLHAHHDGASAADCKHCAEAVQEISDEFAQIVAEREATDTGPMNIRAELDALLYA